MDAGARECFWMEMEMDFVGGLTRAMQPLREKSCVWVWSICVRFCGVTKQRRYRRPLEPLGALGVDSPRRTWL